MVSIFFLTVMFSYNKLQLGFLNKGQTQNFLEPDQNSWAQSSPLLRQHHSSILRYLADHFSKGVAKELSTSASTNHSCHKSQPLKPSISILIA